MTKKKADTKLGEKVVKEVLQFPDKLIGKLRAEYNGDRRYYHTWDHAMDVVVTVADLPVRRNSVEHSTLVLAALFHDIVYVPVWGKGESEKASNAFMRACFSLCGPFTYPSGTMPPDVDKAGVLIETTIAHGEMEISSFNPKTDEMQMLFLDADMKSIADEDWQTVLDNDHGIFDEYNVYFSDEQVEKGRREFLRKLLAKQTIFLTEYFSGCEWQARQNIQRLLAERYPE